MLSDPTFVVIVGVMAVYCVVSLFQLRREGLPNRLLVAGLVVVAATDALVAVVFDESSSWQRVVGGYVLTPLLILGGTWFVFRRWLNGRL